MGQISVSDHLHKQLKQLKEGEEHKSLDSVIRVLLERAKRVDSTDDHLTALDDSQYGTIEVTAGYTSEGADIEPLLPPENPTPEEAVAYLDRICAGFDFDYREEFDRLLTEYSVPETEAIRSVANAALMSIEEHPHKTSEDTVEKLKRLFPNSGMDTDTVSEHIELLMNTDLDLGLSPSHVAHILKMHYDSEGVPTKTERTLEVDLNEVVALIEEVEASDTPRKTARELLTANTDNKYSWGTIWFLAPLCPDVVRAVSSNGNGTVSVGSSTGMAWTCDNCRVEGHHTTIEAIRINEFSEVSQVQCGDCGDWSSYGLHDRFPVSHGSDVRVEWESEQPL